MEVLPFARFQTDWSLKLAANLLDIIKVDHQQALAASRTKFSAH